MRASDIVVCLVPNVFNLKVMEYCLEARCNLVNASYVTDQIKAIEEKVRAKGLTFLCEMGLDPGIDHIVSMKMIRDAQRKGQKVLSYTSYCGGLVQQQFLNNPL